MSINIRFGGFDKVLKSLEVGPGKMQDAAILRLSQVTYEDSQKGANRHHKEGALRQSLYNRKFATGRAVGHDLDRAPHAEWILFGTPPHDIRPKNRKALRFVIGGRFVFAKGVRHPGYRGDGYLFSAADKAIAQFSTIIDAAMKESF